MGYASRPSVLSYLGVSEIESWVVPQIAIIDRKGVIRAQSESQGHDGSADRDVPAEVSRRTAGRGRREGRCASQGPRPKSLLEKKTS